MPRNQKCPWYISARAVREYLFLADATRMDDGGEEWDQAEATLMEWAEAIDAGEQQGKRVGDLVTYRGPRPLRLQLIVSTVRRPEGPLPQLVSVMPGNERERHARAEKK